MKKPTEAQCLRLRHCKVSTMNNKIGKIYWNEIHSIVFNYGADVTVVPTSISMNVPFRLTNLGIDVREIKTRMTNAICEQFSREGVTFANTSLDIAFNFTSRSKEIAKFTVHSPNITATDLFDNWAKSRGLPIHHLNEQ